MTPKDGDPTLYVLCNDLFLWACADMEELDILDLPGLCAALAESPENGELLWVCRKRRMRPQGAYYNYFSDQEVALLNACGPVRETGFGNPEAAPE
ncbi:MAG: hypothetical protein AAF689_16715 [Pseudomonadota bacterium]